MYISRHADYIFCNPIALPYNIIFKCMKPFILQIISLNHHIYFSNIIITIKTENKPKTLSYTCMFEKCNKCTFLLKNLQSLSYRCTGLTDFELTNDGDPPTHPLIEMLTHLKKLLI